MLPVSWINQVAMKGAVPPNNALAILKLKAKPLNRTRVGNISARKLGKVPSFIASMAPKTIWIIRMTTNGW
ncbi:hypothetical protein D9M73_280250 [compost metagenome]